MTGKEILESQGWTMKWSGTKGDADFLRSKAEGMTEGGNVLAVVVMDGPRYALMIQKVTA